MRCHLWHENDWMQIQNYRLSIWILIIGNQFQYQFNINMRYRFSIWSTIFLSFFWKMEEIYLPIRWICFRGRSKKVNQPKRRIYLRGEFPGLLVVYYFIRWRSVTFHFDKKLLQLATLLRPIKNWSPCCRHWPVEECWGIFNVHVHTIVSGVRSAFDTSVVWVQQEGRDKILFAVPSPVLLLNGDGYICFVPFVWIHHFFA